MRRREDVKMRRCEDEKMLDRPPLLEEPCAQTLSGKGLQLLLQQHYCYLCHYSVLLLPYTYLFSTAKAVLFST